MLGATPSGLGGRSSVGAHGSAPTWPGRCGGGRPGADPWARASPESRSWGDPLAAAKFGDVGGRAGVSDSLGRPPGGHFLAAPLEESVFAGSGQERR